MNAIYTTNSWHKLSTTQATSTPGTLKQLLRVCRHTVISPVFSPVASRDFENPAFSLYDPCRCLLLLSNFVVFDLFHSWKWHTCRVTIVQEAKVKPLLSLVPTPATCIAENCLCDVGKSTYAHRCAGTSAVSWLV